MADWRDCIVILIDLIGVRTRFRRGNGNASSLMRHFHRVVRQQMNAGLTSLDHAYVWNDAALLLAYIDTDSKKIGKSLYDAARLKLNIDAVRHSYAIAVQGQAFPSAEASSSGPRPYDGHEARVTTIEASSYAMANCFEIEAEVKKRRLRYAWYLDERIVKRLRMNKGKSIRVDLLPSRRATVYLYAGDLLKAL